MKDFEEGMNMDSDIVIAIAIILMMKFLPQAVRKTQYNPRFLIS